MVVDVLGVEVLISVDMCLLVLYAVGEDIVMGAIMDSLAPLLCMHALRDGRGGAEGTSSYWYLSSFATGLPCRTVDLRSVRTSSLPSA